MRRLASLAILLAACSGDPAAAPAANEAGADAGPRCVTPTSTARGRSVVPVRGPLDDVLRINHLQAKATHNSYHLQPDGGVVDWRYSHAPLATQLDTQGVRGLELDVRFDVERERFEVFHLPILDEKTTCRVFTDCLRAVRAWSDEHPSHHPLFLHIELKDADEDAVREERFCILEREVLSVFPRELVITPDEVKGSAATLREAVTTKGWPTLGQARGRVLFYIDNDDARRIAYTHGGKDLDGRLMFIDGGEDDPFAAVLIRNGAKTDKDAITALVKRGFVVRTRVDVSIAGALANDRSEFEPGLTGGAQILSTDYPAKVAGTDYVFEIPGGTPSRCNPVTAPVECNSAAVESLPR
jgi:hypothetical protein